MPANPLKKRIKFNFLMHASFPSTWEDRARSLGSWSQSARKGREKTKFKSRKFRSNSEINAAHGEAIAQRGEPIATRHRGGTLSRAGGEARKDSAGRQFTVPKRDCESSGKEGSAAGRVLAGGPENPPPKRTTPARGSSRFTVSLAETVNRT